MREITICLPCALARQHHSREEHPCREKRPVPDGMAISMRLHQCECLDCWGPPSVQRNTGNKR